MKPRRVIIEVVNPVESRINKESISFVNKCMTYTDVCYISTGFGKKRVEKLRSFLRDGEKFPTGLINRVLNYCRVNGVPYKLIGKNEWDIPIKEVPILKGITFREDQIKILNSFYHNKRGVILSPTGSGKTILAFGILSMLKDYKTLIIIHNTDIIHQFLEDSKKFGFNMTEFTGDVKDMSGDVVIATRQTLAKIDPKKYAAEFEAVIIDECHHVQDPDGEYSHILSHLMSPIRIGFTATLPKKRKKLLNIEGLLGEVIANLTIQEAIDKGIIVKPKITLISVPLNESIATKVSNYRSMYAQGIVKNKLRNRLICKAVKERSEKGKTTLIIIKKIEHAKILKQIAESKYNFSPVIVYGNTAKEDRNKIKNFLNKKSISCVICSDVWREGINIPSLNSVINAAGLKDEIQTIQAIGRGLRTSQGKMHLELVDFLDPYRWLSNHTVLRLQIYVNYGWL